MRVPHDETLQVDAISMRGHLQALRWSRILNLEKRCFIRKHTRHQLKLRQFMKDDQDIDGWIQHSQFLSNDENVKWPIQDYNTPEVRNCHLPVPIPKFKGSAPSRGFLDFFREAVDSAVDRWSRTIVYNFKNPIF